MHNLTLLALLLVTINANVALGGEFNDNRLGSLIPGLLEEEQAAGVGISVIRNGEAVWFGYYGKAGPDEPITQDTVFNTASIAKTIAAETYLRLTSQGLIDLEEKIATYVRHPDLAQDPRYNQLTPKLLLSHRAGLLNWGYLYADGKLAFDHDPDSRFSYSGAGFELAVRFAEAKLGSDYDELASAQLMAPLGIVEIALGNIPSWAESRLATPMDSEGRFRPIHELNTNLAPGKDKQLGAADDLLVTVPAYTKFLEALLNDPLLNSELQVQLRETIVTDLDDDPVYDCVLEDSKCPTHYGHSIGWQVYDYGQHKIIMHSGSDAGENALVYFSPDKKHGAVIFVNGANGWVIMTRILEVIGDEPLLAEYFRGLINEVMGRDLPPLAAAIDIEI